MQIEAKTKFLKKSKVLTDRVKNLFGEESCLSCCRFVDHRLLESRSWGGERQSSANSSRSVDEKFSLQATESNARLLSTELKLVHFFVLKENDRYFRDIDRLSQSTREGERHRSHNNQFSLSSEQNETIDNLVQKLEDHIATELDR